MADSGFNITVPEQALPESSDGFGPYIRSRRLHLRLTLRQLEGMSGIHRSRLSRYESGAEIPRRLERLTAIAEALDLPVTQLYALAGVDLSGVLPSLQLYLRSKYGDQLPPEALAQIEAYGAKVAERYGVNTGPALGEDE